MLNANMRTDMLRSVHQGIAERKKQPHQKSPLEMLIESIEQTLVSFEGGEHVAAIGPNPFQTDPPGRFEPDSDYQTVTQRIQSPYAARSNGLSR